MPNLSIYDFSQMLRKYNSEEKFIETSNYFKENKIYFTEKQLSENEFIVSDMLNALRKQDKYDGAFKFLSIYGIQINERTPERILNGYGWLLYSKYKADNLYNEHNHIFNEDIEDDDHSEVGSVSFQFDKNDICYKIVNLFPLLLKFSNQYVDNLISKLFNLVIKVEKKKPAPNWRMVNEFCDIIPPERLGTICSTIEVERKGKKVPTEQASDRENWYAYKSKALMSLKMYQESYDTSVTALAIFSKFHYSNDVWFARRIALSKKNLGNIIDAISELEAVLMKKREWFIQKELASLYQETGNYEKAFTYAIEAINNYGDLEYKVDLLFLISELLLAKKEDELAFKHLSLSQLIRVREEWKIPEKLKISLSKFNKPNVPVESYESLKIELRKYWGGVQKSQPISKSEMKPRQVGKINRILHNDDKGADGFIKFNDSQSIYFKVNVTEEIIKCLQVGLDVEFTILPAVEDKKEKAVKLKLLK